MKKALLIHGICDREEYFSDEHPSLSNNHWFPWLQKQLLIRGIFTQTPEMPDAYDANYDYKKWKEEFEKNKIDEETILVGHSCGAGFLVRWLSENNAKAKKLILVAPWMDPNHEGNLEFFNFQIDPNLINRVSAIHIFVSENDSEDVKESTRIINNVLKEATMHRFQDKGHFTLEAMGTDEFPELLSAILE
jgi:predicted alpha/beta hydrolase family esterase